MSLNRFALRRPVFALALALSLSASLFAKQDVHIDNFGIINPAYYRGAQPRGGDFSDLSRLGIRTVIDLAAEGRADERLLVEHAGMRFYRIPLTTSSRPSDAAVIQFLKLVNDPANQPVFVHCQGGRHRTGVMTAVYRMTHDNWTAQQAYAEMKRYRFETLLGHPALKQFVFDYYAHLAQPQITHTVKGATTISYN